MLSGFYQQKARIHLNVTCIQFCHVGERNIPVFICNADQVKTLCADIYFLEEK